MAQLERTTRRSTDTQKMPSAQTSPTFEQLLRVDEAYWSPTTSPRSGTNQIHQEESLSPPQNRKSVLAKVKEKAKKLRHSLSGRKNIHEYDLNDDNTTPPSGLAIDDNYDDDPTDDPEYLGAPMYESEAAPESLKENARQHPRAVPVVAENHRTPIRNQPSEPSVEHEPTVAETVSQKSAQAYTAISDATHKITSKISGLAVSCETAPRKWDKGVSVKEHFVNKVEPVEDERALSQAVTEAISPKKITNNTGVVEKVKEAVTSFFWNEEPSNLTARPLGSARPAGSHSSRLNYSDAASSAPCYPVSSSAREVVEEENHGKILQTN